MVEFPRLHLLMNVELEERIERQQLDAGALVEHLTRNAREDLLHHTICALVAIVERLAEQATIGIHQAVIDPPGIDADAVERSGTLMCFTQSCQGIVPQTQDIPEAVPMHHHRSIGKAMHLFDAERSPIEADEQHTSTTGTQVDCGHIACLHHLSPYRGYAAATPPSTLRILPVLLVERVGEAKNATASAISSVRILTPSVVRLRYTSSS